jgi:hypothetical protein
VKAYLSSLSQLQNLTGFGKGNFVSDLWVKIKLRKLRKTMVKKREPGIIMKNQEET